MEDHDEVAGGPLSFGGSFGGSSQSGFDIRVTYVRVTGCRLEDAPESLAMRFPARSVGVCFKVNGARISPLEEVCVVLRRDRVDTETAEATYVSTDNLRVSGTISYEVLDMEEALVSGTLEQSESGERSWSMGCRCVIGKTGCAFLSSRREFSSASLMSPPAMEVSMAGRQVDTPVFLTRTVHLIARRKISRALTLDAIPETKEFEKSTLNGLIPVGSPQLIRDREPYADPDKSASDMVLGDKLAAGMGYGLDSRVYGIEGEDGQMTWFNAGLRVGVGIGLGMCLGAGIGIGLMIRTYQATTKTLRKII